MSLVLRSQQAPSMNRPLTNTPDKKGHYIVVIFIQCKPTIIWWILVLFVLQHIKVKPEQINWNLITSGKVLLCSCVDKGKAYSFISSLCLHTSEKSLCEKEAGYAENRGWSFIKPILLNKPVILLQPVPSALYLQELQPCYQVIYIATQWL